MEKTVIISGGTSGIGKAMLIRLLNDGFSVATFSRHKKSCEQLEKGLKEKMDADRFMVMNADVADEKQMAKFVKAVAKRFKSVDILINNAGFGYFEDCDKVDMKEYHELIQTNLVGVANLVKHTVPIMKEKGSGLIINIASMSGMRSYPKGSFYSSTKFGVMGYSDGLRKELEEHGIKVSTVCPGVVETNFFTDEWKKRRREENRPMMDVKDVSRLISLICTQSEHSNIQHVEILPF
jgi:NADP-dependent 3-hydroxy acid dehydrogenase YdfG